MRKENGINDKQNVSVLNHHFKIKEFQIFAGVQLIYCDACTQSVNLNMKTDSSDKIIEIVYCREGRLEYRMTEEFCYISSGDLAIIKTNDISSEIRFPLGHYHGITVRVDLNQMPNCFSCLQEEAVVHPGELERKFCKEGSNFIVRSNSAVEHIFAELYSVPIEIQKVYFKIKILELFLFLSVLDTDQNESASRTYSKTQADIAMAVEQYLLDHMDNRITLNQLSEHFHISGTHIKNTFKSVYGISLYSFIRTQKMESAAYMLKYSDKSILEIAGACGYNNASKFAGAFRDIKGVSPNEYRNLCLR